MMLANTCTQRRISFSHSLKSGSKLCSSSCHVPKTNLLIQAQKVRHDHRGCISLFGQSTKFGDWKSNGRIDYEDDDDDEDEKKRTLRCDRMRKTRDATKM